MFSELDPSLFQNRWERQYCECGCAEAEMSRIVGFCLHCDHVYAEFNPKIQALHFAEHCPGVPESLRQTARAQFIED